MWQIIYFHLHLLFTSSIFSIYCFLLRLQNDTPIFQLFRLQFLRYFLFLPVFHMSCSALLCLIILIVFGKEQEFQSSCTYFHFPLLRCFRKTEKSDNQLSHVCPSAYLSTCVPVCLWSSVCLPAYLPVSPSVRPYATSRFPLDEVSRYFIFECFTKIQNRGYFTIRSFYVCENIVLNCSKNDKCFRQNL